MNGPAQQRVDPDQQLGHPEGLDQVVVCSGVEAGQSVVETVGAGQEQHD